MGGETGSKPNKWCTAFPGCSSQWEPNPRSISSPSRFIQRGLQAPATIAVVSEWPLEEAQLGPAGGGPGKQPARPVAKSSRTVWRARGAISLSTGRPYSLSCIWDPRTQESNLRRKSSICSWAWGNGSAHSLDWLLMGSIQQFWSFVQKPDQIRELKIRKSWWLKGEHEGASGIPAMPVSWSR